MRATKGSTIVGLIVAVLLTLMAGAAWGAVTGIVSGTVSEADTGAALSGANVVLSGSGLTTVSDAAGKFTITNVPPGLYTVCVSLIGYTDLNITGVTVNQGEEARLEARLQPALVEAAGAVEKVTAPRVTLRQDLVSPAYVVSSGDETMTLSQPNDRYQFPGLVIAQPGVVPDNTFYPHVRGARANQVGYFLDGIPITEPNANVFATNIVSIGLDRLELFIGGYPIEYGGYAGGIINEVVKRGDQMEGGVVDVGFGTPYDFGGMIVEKGEVDHRANWYYGLYNWHSRFNENLFTSEAPTVSDGIAKVIYDCGERDKVTLFAHHGYSRYLFPFERMFTFNPNLGEWEFVDPSDDFGRQGYDVDSLSLNHTLSPEAFWNLRFSRVAHFLDLDLGDPGNLFWQQRNERMVVGQFDYQRQMGAHRISAGLWQLNSDNNSRYSVFGTQFSPFGLLDSISNNDTGNTQVYLGDKWQVNDRLLLSAGARRDAMTYDREVAGSATLAETTARGGATYVVTPRLMLRGSLGTYVGFPRANLIASRFVPHLTENPDFEDWGLTWDMLYFPSFPLRPQIDRERELGLEWKAGSNTLVTATAFRRTSSQMMQRWQGVLHDANGDWVLDANGNPIPSFALSDFDPDAPVWFAANGTGTARGEEVQIDRKLSDGTRAWLSYTHLDAQATSPQDNLYPSGYGFLNQTDPASLAQEFPVDWNQEHTAVLAVHHQFGKLAVNPWAIYGSGFPYGQSGLDVGGSDPAHVPNPNYNPDDPSSPEELVIPQNYVDPSNPSRGFISPNSLMTGSNLTFNLNFWYDLGPGRQVYFQIFNVTDRDDVTSYVIYHPRTGGLIGDIAGEAISYVPFSRTPPRFFAFGVRQEF